jgi:mannose-6-phosphate isomerase-like protein (cupin superfamily)
MTKIKALKITKKPWGKERMLLETGRLRLKLLYIRNNECTSLQYHRRKRE